MVCQAVDSQLRINLIAPICCDLARHVFFAEHTDPAVAQALRDSHWMDLREWIDHASGAVPGAA